MKRLLVLSLLLAASAAHAQDARTAERRTAAERGNGYGAAARSSGSQSSENGATTVAQSDMLLFSGKPREEAPRKHADFSLIHPPAIPVMAGQNTWR